jgi:hypothetical protein
VNQAKINTNSPEDGQTDRMADKSETKKMAMPAITSKERGAGGIAKCAPTYVPGNFATFAKLQLHPASTSAAYSFDRQLTCKTHLSHKL